jgi:hypothetical protein
LTLAAARASRQNRFRAVSSCSSDSIILTATVRARRSSRAWYTTPIPPEASFRSIV